MLKINKEKLSEHGFSFESMEDLYFYVLESIEWLESHYKNYNNRQYRMISDLKDILNCIEDTEEDTGEVDTDCLSNFSEDDNLENKPENVDTRCLFFCMDKEDSSSNLSKYKGMNIGLY